MKILGIETSCDETAASVIEGKGNKVKVLSNVVSSQIEIHKKYGGVVPEVAAREHVLDILLVINKSLEKAGIKKDFSKNIDAISVTVGPGLVTSLIVGVETAKSLSYAWGIPIIGVNHIEGHIYANFVGENKNIKFPALILTVSGGHTLLVLMKGHGKYELIGETRDDAAGEAFDKAAQLMNIGYPGGPILSKYARKFKGKLSIDFPRPMINKDNFDFSFSGLKTSILYKIKKDSSWKKKISEYCYGFEQAIVDVLITKMMRATQKYKVKTLMLAGGVSANTELRKQFKKRAKELDFNGEIIIPDLKYTTDNAVMIATAGYFRVRENKFNSWDKIKVNPNLEL
ncbi:tRNA (adenosine(37)-N6)-threonylcarbamoyltransferase complex transferase subunit TsaD [bacterium]|nr:tRNA (adenosine(37)-N6)-threonylcarbamoyltransferase complex transferase subunit TsaD [bacterium]